MSPADASVIDPTIRDRANLFLVIAIGGVLALLIMPLPPQVLDLLLAANITLSLLVMFSVVATQAPREFTSFPSLLLFLTLFRLGLNVASSRLILLEGEAGEVIEAFGNFVVGGNLIVGVIMFAILLIVQFVVITKGAGRISEVAARFTLDGLPGKQMAIDADLNSGVIDSDEARRRRQELMRESEFYGSMDGASKFVRGDAVAGLIITAVNLVGGGVIGLMKGMALADAANLYSILTIGDGLVAQIPALIVSIAGALLVTKSSVDKPLAFELHSQLFAKARIFLLCAVSALVMGFLPGLPAVPFLLLGGGFLALAKRIERVEKQKPKAIVQSTAPPKPESEQIEELLHVDRLLVEVGYRLVGLVQGGIGGGLLERIGQLRKRFATEMGVVLPPIRVRDSALIDPRGYRILMQGEVIAEGQLAPGCFLAMPPSADAEPIPGVATRDPTFGLPAFWVREELRDEAEAKGYTAVETSAVLATHLGETLRRHAGDIVTRDDTKLRVERLKEASPALVEDVSPSPLPLGDVHKVLRNLLREGVSVRNLAPIFEALADHVGRTKDADVLTEFVRERVARSIVSGLVDERGVLHALTLDPGLEQRLADLGNDPTQLGHLLRLAAREVREAAKASNALGRTPVLVVRPTLRRVLALTLLDEVPRVPVASYNEIAAVSRIEPAGIVALREEK
jgi:flagellar biosynthesis protein FlhA